MKFPSITQYIETVNNLAERVKSLKEIEPLRDKSGMPLFYSARGVVNFPVKLGNSIASLKCCTSILGYEQLKALHEAGIVHGTFYEEELMVFGNDDIANYYPIFIENDIQNSVKSDDELTEFWEELKPFEENNLWGYRDSEGNIAIAPEYDSAEEFSEGRAVVGRKGLFGLIDRDGNFVLNMEFDEISWDGSALAYVDSFGKWGCYDRLGREIVKCQYDWVGEYFHSLLLVQKNGKYGYVNLQSEEVIPLIYEDATSFNTLGVANVTLNGQKLIINTSGEVEK